MAAINTDAMGCLKRVKFQINLKKKFLEDVLKPMRQQFVMKAEEYFDLAEEKSERYCSYTNYPEYDFDLGMSSLETDKTLEDDIRTFEKEIDELEGLL